MLASLADGPCLIALLATQSAGITPCARARVGTASVSPTAGSFAFVLWLKSRSCGIRVPLLFVSKLTTKIPLCCRGHFENSEKSNGEDIQLLKRTGMLGSVQKLRNLMKRELLIYGRLQRSLPWLIPVLRFSLLQNEWLEHHWLSDLMFEGRQW